MIKGSADSLTVRTTFAAQWRLAGSLAAAAFQFGIGVFLARLLTPADFGVVALAFVVLGLTQIVGDLGMAAAVVQRAELTERHIRTAFTLSSLLGIVVAVVVAAAAPVAAAVMREPALTAVLGTLALAFALRGVAGVAGALLRRNLDFRRQFWIDTISYIVGYAGVALTLALLGYGVWSLVWGSLVQAFLASAAQLAVVRHPVRPLVGQRELPELLHFGVGMTMIGLANYIALNGDNFVVGRWMGTASLGLYSRAYNLMNLPHTYLASVMSSVLLPAFSHAQADSNRLRRGFLLVTQLTAMVAGPLMGAMVIAAPHLVSTLYGPQWMGVVGPLQILCAAGYFRALYHLDGIVAQSVGRVYSEFWRQIGYAALVLGGAFFGARYGLQGVATGVAVAIVYMFVASGYLALSITGATWRAYFRVQALALVTAAITCGIAVAIRVWLEASEASSPVITIAIVGGSAIPWSLGLLWALGAPGFEPLRAKLPVRCLRLVDQLRKYRQSPFASPA